jgi:glycosyltransferase involved in cell wall biosynthesis
MNLEPDPQHQLAWKRYLRLLRATDAFVAVSQAVAADFLRRTPQRLIGVIPNGFDPEVYDPTIAHEQPMPPEIANLGSGFPLWVAYLEKRKHPEVLIALANKHPEIEFVALGAASETEGRVFAQAFRNLPNIHWLGAVERSVARTILARAGVLLFPSEREGLSLAMIEALAMGIPIICQPKSSMPELVTTGVNGELIDIVDLEAWSAAMTRYVKFSNEKRAELFRRVRENAVATYSWSKVGASYGPIYREVMKKPANFWHMLSR